MSLFGGLASAIKSKVAEVNEVKIMLEKAEVRCAAEAETYEKSVEETKAQQKLLSFLLSNAFEQYEKSQTLSIGDWKHLPQHTEIRAAKKYSLLTWSEYSFYTYDGVYYHNKKKGVHAFLYYDGINVFDAQTCDVDYGKLHEKRNIADWPSFDKKVIELISDIHRDVESANAAILAFCFDKCSDFRNALRHYKSNEIRNAFKKYEKYMSEVLRENWDHIQIVTMDVERIDLQFWAYFSLPEEVCFSEDDDEDEIAEKEREQKRRQEEYDEKIEHAELVQMWLAEERDDIVELFQNVLFDVYGVSFPKENITYLENADFTYEKPSVIDRLEDSAGAVRSFLEDYTEKHGGR